MLPSPPMRSLTFQRSIGSGAFGTVYLAELSSRQGFRRQVAVKVLHKQAPEDGEQLLSRIRDEARLLGLLQDDIIIKVLEIARVADRDAVLMEYIEGVDLQTLTDKGMRPSARALAEIGALVAGGLSRAHLARHPTTGQPLNVIHRDVKPANIMVTRSGGVKLLDFGVARARFDARESHTGQLVLGTLNYMAPEYIVTGEVSPAADVYGLAVSLWQVATGEPYGQPKVRQDSHERRLQSRLSLLAADYGPMLPCFEHMLRWDHTRRPDAHTVESILDRVSGNLSGDSLRLWARQAVSEILDGRGPGKDAAGLVGRTIDLADEQTSGPVEPSRPTPRLADPGLVDVPPPVVHPPRVPIAPPAVPHTSTAPVPQAPIFAATPSAPTNAPPASAPSGVDPSLVKAIVGGLLVGGSVGLLVVAALVAWLLMR